MTNTLHTGSCTFLKSTKPRSGIPSVWQYCIRNLESEMKSRQCPFLLPSRWVTGRSGGGHGVVGADLAGWLQAAAATASQGLSTGAPARALKAARLRPRRPGLVQPRARMRSQRAATAASGDSEDAQHGDRRWLQCGWRDEEGGARLEGGLKHGVRTAASSKLCQHPRQTRRIEARERWGEDGGNGVRMRGGVSGPRLGSPHRALGLRARGRGEVEVVAMESPLSCMVATYPLWGIFPSIWRVWTRPSWDAISGQLDSKFGHGPKTKFAAHTKLYKFY